MSGRIKAMDPKRPEVMILSTCGHFKLLPGEVEALRDASMLMDEKKWASVHDEAIERRSIGLLVRHLRDAGLDIPREFTEAQRTISVVNAGWDIELEKLARHLKTENVPVLLIKGAALQGHVYREAGLRLMDDVDWILRTPDDLEPVCRSLRKCGYRNCGDGYSHIWTREGYLIDLHFGVLGDDRLLRRKELSKDAETRERIAGEIWSRALPSRLGEFFLVPAPEDHLIILCSHIMKHNFEPGIWFADLEALIGRESHFDWEACIERAKAWNIFRPLSYAFQGMDESRIPMPRWAAKALREMQPTRLDEILLKLAGEGIALKGEKESWSRPPLGNLLWLSSQPTLRAKVQLLWEAAFPRNEVMADIYPEFRSRMRWWFMARRAADLIRLGMRVLALSWTGRR